MARSLPPASASTQPDSLRNGSQSRTDQLAAIRTPDRPLRMTAKTDRATTCALVRQCMAETGLTQKAMAINAEISEAVLSDALAPHGTRNLAAEWLFDQEDAFLLALVEKLMRARGLTPASKREVAAERISELVKLLISEAA